MKKLITLCSIALCAMTVFAADPANGLKFDNSESAYFDLGQSSIDNTMISAPTAITVEAWVMYNSTPGGCTGYIVSNESGDNGGYSLRFENFMEICVGSFNDTGGKAWIHCASDIVPEAGVWYHVAFTYDEATLTLKYYVNGVLANTTMLSAAIIPTTKPLSIGEGAEWKGRRLDGALSDLRIWSVVRTDEEVAADMTNSLTGTEPGLVANWKMNECQGENVADITNNFNMSIPDPATITWFGEPAAVHKLATTNVNALVNGKSLTIANGSDSAMDYSVYNVAGVNVISGTVKANASIVKNVSMNGVFFVKGITKNGKTFNQKVVF